MYDAGYKLMSIWVPKTSEGKAIKMERSIFLRRIEALTAGWPKKKLLIFFAEILEIVKEKIKEAE